MEKINNLVRNDTFRIQYKIEWKTVETTWKRNDTYLKRQNGNINSR